MQPLRVTQTIYLVELDRNEDYHKVFPRLRAILPKYKGFYVPVQAKVHSSAFGFLIRDQAEQFCADEEVNRLLSE